MRENCRSHWSQTLIIRSRHDSVSKLFFADWIGQWTKKRWKQKITFRFRPQNSAARCVYGQHVRINAYTVFMYYHTKPSVRWPLQASQREHFTLQVFQSGRAKVSAGPCCSHVPFVSNLMFPSFFPHPLCCMSVISIFLSSHIWCFHLLFAVLDSTRPTTQILATFSVPS